MISRTVILSLLLAFAEARFGQEQVPIAAISAIQGGSPGAASTIAGAAISDLLGGANACDKLKRGDQILAELGTGADSVAAAKAFVGSEKNFNNFNDPALPTICSDASLPANDVLRGIIPLIDPAVDGAAAINALAAQSLANPVAANGKSVADLLTEAGFTNFIAQAVAGGAAAGNAGQNGNQNKNNGKQAKAGNGKANAGQNGNQNKNNGKLAKAGNGTANAGNGTANAGQNGNQNKNAAGAVVGNGTANANCPAVATVTVTAAAPGSTAAAPAAGEQANNGKNAGVVGNAGNSTAGNTGVQKSTISGLDFGKCVPTIDLKGGRANRKADELTFLPTDPLVAQGQQEALNPNIITNRVCDQLTNVCEANTAAKTACKDAQAQILALGTRDQATADTFNELLGFAGAASGAGAAKRSTKWRA